MRNRLSEETSPYLLQHADNPVHWQAWTPEALELARAENKPILLSVGYSACHWCHVMAHESFEDADTARVMNDLFVNIKVDREERPDIDKIYQTAHQLFTGRPGGWPLTVFLTPDSHVPIFTGTYFPKDRRYGMPSFREVLTAIDGYYRTQSDEIRRRGASLADAFAELDTGAADDLADLSAAPLRLARERLAQSYDREHGGFGNAPKFPHTT
ncbi:MAG TPA: thioredoxin domain-containing protein, partial [Gammaproteobacteria bacterium]|nr:thioredoxin domain-containing protein [Gammaproteobacteria bacterium]